MKSLSGVGLGLSIVFGCFLLALVAEVYYLLWWKKRLTSRDLENDFSNPARDFLFMFCWKSSSSVNQEIRMTEEQQQCHPHHLHSNKDLLFKPFGHHHHYQTDHGRENDLMRLHGVSESPKFLFTIVEETMEDLESEEANSKCDLPVETPFLTPLASPPFFTPPLTPMDACYSHQGFNPLFESATDAEFNRIRSSPPPKFKFLQEAEEKLEKKKSLEAVDCNDGFDQENGEEDGSFITIIVDRSKEIGFSHNHQQQFHPSTTSQVLPLSF
ncbi:hypothetical protein DITRI_Ditri09bG0128900 [Diplodiscus trichospermus]